jgi:hypothetical protein
LRSPTFPAQQVGQRRIAIEHDLDGNPLHHLGEIAGRIVGRQQRKLGAGCR